MMRKFLSVVGASVAISLAMPLAAQAETNALVVLDNSNSMWGQVDGVNKIVTARKMLEDFLQQLPGDVNVGLLAYGFNREADCTDIEVVTSVSAGTSGEVIERANRMLPKGKSPIADALEMSAIQFPDASANNNIILFSDGVETCGGDACQVAADIAANNPGMRVHVVGFDVNAEERSVLQCIAEASGGSYFHSPDTEDLIAALGEAPAEAVAIVEPEPIIEPEPLVAEAEPEPLLGEPEPLVAEAEPEPLLGEPEPEPLLAEAEPEPLLGEPEPEPEPLLGEPEPLMAEFEPEPETDLAPEFQGNDKVVFVNVDKARLIKLGSDIGSVQIAQPGVADVVIQSKRQVYIIGRFPGSTNIHVLDEDGRTIFKRDVIVTKYKPRSAPVQVSVYTLEENSVIVPAFTELLCSPRCEVVWNYAAESDVKQQRAPQ